MKRKLQLLWKFSWAGQVALASIIFPHDRLVAFTLLVTASAAFNSYLPEFGKVAERKA